MDQKHKRLSIIGFAILLVTLLGGTYAFFNYTRTGSANNIRTGRIYFNSTQGEELTLTNVFPMTSSEAGDANLDTVTVGIMGDTTYTDGEEFEVTLVDVTNTINGKEIPMNFIATYTAATGATIGTSSDTYWESREGKDANIYKLNATGEVKEGKQVLVGYIKNGSTGISGTLTIKAYIDDDRIAISDTYNVPSATPNDNMGTTSEWVNGRTVLTTTEWNSLANTPISFKIKVESNEGIWTSPQIESCIGCKFLYTENIYQYAGQNQSTINDLASNNEELVDDYRLLNINHFLGFKFENDKLVRAYACGIKQSDFHAFTWVETIPGVNEGTPFCIEGATDGSKYAINSKIMRTIWNDLNYENSCEKYRLYNSTREWTSCYGSISANIVEDGFTYLLDEYNSVECYVDNNGTAACD